MPCPKTMVVMRVKRSFSVYVRYSLYEVRMNGACDELKVRL